MKRNLLAALSANTFFVVSCGGTDPAEAYIKIANKANCGLAEVAAWYESDEALVTEGNEDFEPLVSKFQSLHAGAAAALKTGMEEIAAVEWPENVADDVDVFLTDLGKVVTWMEGLSNAETLDDVVEISNNLDEPDLDSSEAIEAGSRLESSVCLDRFSLFDGDLTAVSRGPIGVGQRQSSTATFTSTKSPLWPMNLEGPPVPRLWRARHWRNK